MGCNYGRKTAEHYLKRKLKPEERVHHINFDPTDNRIANLIVFASTEAHAICHTSRGFKLRKKTKSRGFAAIKSNRMEYELDRRNLLLPGDIVLYGPSVAKGIDKRLKRTAEKTKKELGVIAQ